VKTLKCLIAVIVAAIVGNALDFAVQAKWLGSAYYSKIDSMRMDTPVSQFVFADFVGVFVLAWVLCRLSASFASGAKGGATAGFYLGVLASFPAHHFTFLMFRGYPYSLVWINTVYAIVWYVIIGAILGAFMCKPAAPAAAS
jgi:hypothetical protein